MQLDLPKAVGLLLLVIAVGVAGLVGSGMMILETTLMMVAPSMILFGAIAFLIGMKHGEFRATHG
ncbi:DUF7333 family protein [Halorubrum vacuolatum]|uniref:Uncharacterized protein n=1 Tax=Halorubrum vacuolatum TaxID=63740 RepID=A0A238UPI0_HALVU|nr:hypothetical protein [Halorubrum vacuolatum]SNR23179.1 hypothetical protein SAMN06264855_10173 [Halorubrum vacuolatum]